MTPARPGTRPAKLRVAVHGAAGRMGLSIVRALREDAGAELVAALEHADSAALGKDVGVLAGGESLGVAISAGHEAGLRACDVVIDFSLPAPTARLAAKAAALEKPAVIGTTGLDAEQVAALETLAGVAPIVFAPNYSQGVNLLFHLAAKAAELAGPGFDAEIVEMHHRRKVDAPSGTAVRLYEVVAEAKGLPVDGAAVHGRSGPTGARSDGEIGVMTLRGGDVVGEHTLMLAALGERLELTHRATDRHIFARGAVRAAHWLLAPDTKPGRYDMGDVMNLR